MPDDRTGVLGRIADHILAPGRGPRVGVDGPDGAGKTRFADELAAVLRARGRPVVRVSVDDFHHVRAVRHRRGRHSPEGFWRDSYDYDRFRADVLTPFARDGSRRYRPAAHDLDSDAVLDPEWQTAAPDSVLIVDGLFLHRDELAGIWDVSVFLEVPFAVTTRRMAVRDRGRSERHDPLCGRPADLLRHLRPASTGYVPGGQQRLRRRAGGPRPGRVRTTP